MSEVNIRKLMSVLLEKDSLTAEPEMLRAALDLSEDEMKLIIPNYRKPKLEKRDIEREYIERKLERYSKENNSIEDTIEEIEIMKTRAPFKGTGHLTPYSDTQHIVVAPEIDSTAEPQIGEWRPSKSFYRERDYIKPREMTYSSYEIEEMIKSGRIKDRIYAKVLMGDMSYKDYLKDNPELLKSQRMLSIGRKTLEFYNRKCTPQEYFYEGISLISHSEYHRKGNGFLYSINYNYLETGEEYIARIIKSQIEYTKHVNRATKNYNILKDDSFFRKFKFSMLKQYIPPAREIARYNVYKAIIDLSRDTRFINTLEDLNRHLENYYKDSEESVILSWFMNNLMVTLDEIKDINGLFIKDLPKDTMGELYDSQYKEKSKLRKANKLISQLYEYELNPLEGEINKYREVDLLLRTMKVTGTNTGSIKDAISILYDYIQNLRAKIHK
ncbi:hypothetical protein D3C81_850170 [compost metagenome]